VDDVRFRDAAERVVSPRADNRGGLVFTDRGHNLVIANDGQDCGIRRTQSRSAARFDEGGTFAVLLPSISPSSMDGYRKGFYLCFPIGEGEDGLAFQEWVVIGRQ
jgi:hypothetical protein